MATKQHTRGFSLLEMLVYVALLAAFSVIVATTLLSVARSYHTLRAGTHLQSDAMAIVDRLAYEVRLADSVDVSSTLGTSPGVLKLSATDSAGNATTTEFYLGSGILHVRQNGAEAGTLSSSYTTVDSLIFRQVGSGSALGIRTEMTLTSRDGTASTTQNFYTFFTMRGAH